MKINNCENCHHHNSLIHWEEGIFYQCIYNKKMWEECDAYDPIEIDNEVLK